MVTRITATSRLHDVLLYNEKKVAHKGASLIHSNLFLTDPARLTLSEKEDFFRRQNELNPRSKVNMLHISVSFSAKEKVPAYQLTRIADRYMEGLTLDHHPYLVYLHTDAAHPHIHIVSTLIDQQGKRLRTQNIGKNKSEQIRKAIEKEFDLIAAGKQPRIITQARAKAETKAVRHTRPTAPAKPTKEAIQDDLHQVMTKYSFTNLDEYNAILRLYQVQADPGRPLSKLAQHHGLLYRKLNQQGQPNTAPIKASALAGKPTLKALDKKFQVSEQQHLKATKIIESKLHRIMQQLPEDLSAFGRTLREEGLEIILPKANKDPNKQPIVVDTIYRSAIPFPAGHQAQLTQILSRFPVQQKKQGLLNLTDRAMNIRPQEQAQQPTVHQHPKRNP